MPRDGHAEFVLVVWFWDMLPEHLDTLVMCTSHFNDSARAKQNSIVNMSWLEVGLDVGASVIRGKSTCFQLWHILVRAASDDMRMCILLVRAHSCAKGLLKTEIHDDRYASAEAILPTTLNGCFYVEGFALLDHACKGFSSRIPCSRGRALLRIC